MPYKIQFMEAQTASEKAQASLYAVNQLYQQRLIDSGYIEALCRQMEASASGTEADSVVKGITAKLRSGNTLEPADFGDSAFANIAESLWNGVVTKGVNNGLAVVTNLLEYMPPILLAPGAPSAQVKSRTPLIYGPKDKRYHQLLDNMALFTFERLLSIIETICTILLSAIEKLKDKENSLE